MAHLLVVLRTPPSLTGLILLRYKCTSIFVLPHAGESTGIRHVAGMAIAAGPRMIPYSFVHRF